MKKIILFFIISLLISCSGKNEVKKPEKFIEKQEMENILFDLAILQATRNYDTKLLYDNHIDSKKYIYQKYHIDSLQFAENNRYYAADFKEYKELFERVISRIEKQKTEISKTVAEEEKRKQKRIRDSIIKSSKH